MCGKPVMQKFVQIMHNNPAQMAKYVLASDGGNVLFLRNKFMPALYVANAVRQREVEHVVSAAPHLGNDMFNCYRLIRKRRESEHHHSIAVNAAIAVAFLQDGNPVGSDLLRPSGVLLLRKAGEVFGKLCGHGRSAATAMPTTRTVAYIEPTRASW